jgi:hypothetical protein
MTDPILDLFPPVPADDEIERTARARGLAELRAAAAPAPAETPRRGARRRWLLVPAALVAAAAAVVIAVTSGVNEGRLSPSPAAALLLRAAETAERDPAPGALGRGEYLYVVRGETARRTVTHRGVTFTVDVRTRYEDWIARDGSGRYRVTPLTPAFPTPADRAAYRRAGSPSLGQEREDHSRAAWPEHAFPSWVGSEAVSYAQARALPTDPQRLARTLRMPKVGGVEMLRAYERIAVYLTGTPLDAAQRSALYRVTATVPGVRVTHDAVIAESDYKGSHYMVALVFDPRSARLVAIRTLISGRDTVDQRTTYKLAVRPSMRA